MLSPNWTTYCECAFTQLADPHLQRTYSKDRNVLRKTLLAKLVACRKLMDQSNIVCLDEWMDSGFSISDEFNCIIKDPS